MSKKITRYTILNKDTRTQKEYAEAFAQVFFNNLSDNEKNIFKRINRNIYNVLKVHVKFNDFLLAVLYNRSPAKMFL